MLLSLLDHKPLADISVKELTDLAGVGYATFKDQFLPDFRETDFLLHFVEKPGTSIGTHTVVAGGNGVFLYFEVDPSQCYTYWGLGQSREYGLSPGEAVTLGRLLRKAEQLAGGPVEIEWALDDSGIKMLQSRPLHVGAQEQVPDEMLDLLNKLA